MRTIEEFDACKIVNGSIQFIDKGIQQPGTKFGCIGKIEGETEILAFIKKCAGLEVKKRSVAQKMEMVVSAHIPVNVARDVFGLSNAGLKDGVYAYGAESKGKNFVFTADVVDDFDTESIVKHIAFTNCSSNTGLKINIENGTDELAELELEFTAMNDKNNQIYYEAFTEEVTDPTVIEKWHTQFTPELVQKVDSPTQ